MAAGDPNEESLPLSAEMRIDAVCVRFEAAWKAVANGGTRPAIGKSLVSCQFSTSSWETDVTPASREVAPG